MEQYIPKSALVAEIEKRRDFNKKLKFYSRLDECNGFLYFLDTLEVKEVKEEPERRNPYSSQIDTDTCWDDGNF